MHSSEQNSLPLVDLEVGQSGELVRDSEEGVPKRLRELGFVPGTRVTLVRRGALGDPIELELRGFRMCLRRRDLSGMSVMRIEN
ncbi:MAG: ferrous iron transport protein A [Myxococcales bacterium]|nr:ferrous iron transport protein A [Myxococcales bacterium]